jgi:succinate-acetate transporter protein
MSWILASFGILWGLCELIRVFVFNREQLTESATEWVKISGTSFLSLFTLNIADILEITDLIFERGTKCIGFLLACYALYKAYMEFKNEKKQKKQNNDK